MTTKDNKRRNGFIMVAVAVVLLVAIVGVAVFLLTSDGGATDDPAEAAREFTSLYQTGLNSAGRDVDVNDFEPVVCAAVMPSLREAFSAKQNPAPGSPQFKLSVKDVKTEGDNGSFTVISEITAPGSEPQTTDEPFNLVKEDGSWRVCGSP